MKKNGYTLIELLVVIGILGIVAFIVISNTSYAFKDNKEELYKESQEPLILRQAVEYGKTLERLPEETEKIISLYDLIDKGYLVPNSEKDDYIDIRTGASMKEINIKIIYNENNEITAEIINQ